MLKATVAVRRVLSRSHGDGTDPVTPVTTRRQPAARRASAPAHATPLHAERILPADIDVAAGDHGARANRVSLRPGWRPAELPSRFVDDGPVAVFRPAARRAHRLGMRAIHSRWTIGRPERAERLVPLLVAVFLLVAAITAAPGLVSQATGATSSSASTVRIVVGGPAGPNGEAPSAVVDPGAAASPAPDPSGGTDGASPQDAAAAAAQAVQVDGQFTTDGTLLKPVVVDPTVEDGRDQLRYYTVKSGDTLGAIAARYNVSVTTIWNANSIGGITSMHVGQELMIPPVNGKVITVQVGDTLESVAATSHVDPQTILAFNNLTDPTLIIGQVLILPGAKLAAVPTPKPTPTPAPVAKVVRRTSGGGTRTANPPATYSGGRLLWPVPGGYISQYFHYGHPAIDIAAPMGTAIRAAGAGVVTYAGWKSNGGGYQVWIAHGSNLYTTYNHMSSVAVSVGDHVSAGTFIGRVGMTGNATGPHCHFEVWIGPIWNGGNRVNPLGYL